MGIEDFVAEAAVEAFDKAILLRPAGLNVMEVNVMAFAPGNELGGDEFGALRDCLTRAGKRRLVRRGRLSFMER